MTCDNCGANCQGKYCTPCGRAKSRDGDFQERLQDAGDLEDDGLAFLGPDVHKCDLCERVIGSLKVLDNHDCQHVPTRDVDVNDVRMQRIKAGGVTFEIGPDPDQYVARRAQKEGESR